MRAGSTAIVWFGLLTLAACDVDTTRWKERQAAVDPPTLWQVEVPGSSANPVQICVDRGLQEGFRRAVPEADGQVCEPTADPMPTGNGGQILQCTLGGRAWRVRTDVSDGVDRFTVDYRAEILDTRRPQVFTQLRRYTRLGPCPEGWRIGENTDQQGRRQNEIWTPAW